MAGLDGLRVFAALCVLFAHGGYFLFAAWPNFDAYVFAGWLGTEVFFALAGFLLIAQLLAQPPRSARGIREWWAWRAWRILPLFWLALALHFLLAQFAQKATGIEAASFVILAQNLAWTHPAFFGEAWNLPVFALFFLIAPMFARLTGAAPSPASRLAWVLVGWLVVGIVVRAVWVLQTEPLWDADIRKIVLSRLDACVYGGLAACLVTMVGPKRRVGVTSWMLAIALWSMALAGFILLPRDASVVAGVGLFVLAGVGSACAVVASSARLRATSNITAALARWSYPLYLINMPVLLAMALLGYGQTADAASGVLRFLVWLVASIACAAAIHRYVEAPLIAARARRLTPPAAPLPHAASAARPTIR